MVIMTEELEGPNYVANRANRCYFRKKQLSGKLNQLAEELLGYRGWYEFWYEF
jgi:PP-loop superfamily ATP-utilizing enzyme